MNEHGFDKIGIIKKLNDGTISQDEIKLALLMLWSRSKENYTDNLENTKLIERLSTLLLESNRSVLNLSKRLTLCLWFIVILALLNILGAFI